MSSLSHLMNFVRRYRGSKGVREHRQGDPPLASLAATCHLEERASPFASTRSIALLTVVSGAALGHNCVVERAFLFKVAVYVCQIVAPFNIYPDSHSILPCANGRVDLFSLCEAELRQSSSSETPFFINASKLLYSPASSAWCTFGLPWH